MGKKISAKSMDNILQMDRQNSKEAQAEVAKYYENGMIASFTLSSETNPLAPLVKRAKESLVPQTPTQEQLSEKCQQIRDNVRQGKTGNIEIQFHKGRQLSDKQAFPLGNTVVKILPKDTNTQDYTFIFIKAGFLVKTCVQAKRQKYAI